MPQNKQSTPHSSLCESRSFSNARCFPYESRGLYKKDSCFCRKGREKESGNVFIIILVAVALFAALMFTFSRSGSQGTSNLSKQKAKIAAQEILSYARLVEGAVDRVRRNGCSESEISFENSVVSGYSNPNSPSDESCNIFSTDGGKLTYPAPNEKWLDSSKSALYAYNEWLFVNKIRVGQLGNICDGRECADLLLYLGFLKKEVCEQLNNIANFESSYIAEGIASVGPSSDDKFLGIFINDQGYIGNQAPELLKKEFACIYRSYNDNYVFYQTLLVR